MKDKLRELADEMEACWICASNGDGEITLETINNWSGRLTAILDAEGDGGAVAKVRHFDYHGVARNGFSQEAEMLDGAPVLPDGTKLYPHPARSGVVSDEDVRDAERYRWLRDDPPTWLSVRKKTNRDLKSDGNMVYLDSHILDHAIDAAIQGDNGDLHLGAPAWPGQLEGKAPPEGWVQLSVNNLSEPVAQGEVVFTGLHIDGSPRYERATNPHSPDAADSARVGDGVMTALAVIYGSGYRHGHEATVEGGYTDVVHYDRETYWLDTVREMVDEDADLAAALAAQGQGEAVAWMAEDDAALSARTSGRMGGINDGTRFISFKELKQGDYRHVFPLYTAPPASPAGVPDGVAEVIRECWKVAHLFHSGDGMLTHVKHALDDAYAAPSAPEGGEVGL